MADKWRAGKRIGNDKSGAKVTTDWSEARDYVLMGLGDYPMANVEANSAYVLFIDAADGAQLSHPVGDAIYFVEKVRD
jgi:hypothetical protein